MVGTDVDGFLGRPAGRFFAGFQPLAQSACMAAQLGRLLNYRHVRLEGACHQSHVHVEPSRVALLCLGNLVVLAPARIVLVSACTWALVRAQTLSNGPFDAGLHPSIKSGQPPVFVTTGLGETALPMRLFNPPVIDILKLE